jgi:hypothetical protein
VSAALDAVKQHVTVPWAAITSTPPPAATEVEAGTESAPGEDTSAAAAAAERVLCAPNFAKALREITPSASEALGTLADLRKWNDEFGEGRKEKGKRQVWGRGSFGFAIKPPGEGVEGGVRTERAKDGQEQ